MVDAREGHSNAYGVFLSPGDWWTLAGGNTPGNRPATLRTGAVLEITAGYPIRPICPIRPIASYPKSTLAHPKSTVDLECEPLIRVENGLRAPLLLTGYRPISGPKIKESNQNQTAANQKIYSASPLIPASRSKCLLPFPSTANEEFQLKIRPLFRQPILTYSTLCQPILPIFAPSFFTGHNQESLFIAIFRFKGIQSYSKHFKAIQGFLETFFYFYALPPILPPHHSRQHPMRCCLGG
jgi:hypothetical protein